MSWLKKEDYYKQIKEDHLNQVVDNLDVLIAQANILAQSEIESYLRAKYDMAALFSTAETERHPLILMYAVDIALYHLHSRIAPRKIPQIRFDRYDSAVIWLKAVAKGEISPDLPQYTDEKNTQQTGGFIFGSVKKTSHDLY